jgi:hypothetical protein
MSYLTYLANLLESSEGWKKGELNIAPYLGRSMGKSSFMRTFIGNEVAKLHGVTTNQIITDEHSGTLTVDKLIAAVEHVEQPKTDVWWNDWPEFGPIPLTEKVGKEWILLNDVKASFKSEEFPDTNTYLVLEKIDKKDPRHPNPKAGTVRNWFVLQGHKKEQVKNRTQGELRAKALHEKEVALIKKRRDDAITEARLIALQNEQRLKALPLFGGF